MVTNKLKLALVLSAFLFAVTTLPGIYSSVVSSGLVPSNGSDQVAATYDARASKDSVICPVNLICTPIWNQPAGCPFGYSCTVKPVQPLDVSGMSCSIYVDDYKLPSVTTVGKPTGGPSAYSYTLFSPYGPIETVPTNEVPGKHGYTQNQGAPNQYLSVTSGTSTAKVMCTYSQYSIKLNLVTGPMDRLGTTGVKMTVDPSSTSTKPVTVKLSFSCPEGVVSGVTPNTNGCNSSVDMIKLSGNQYMLNPFFRNLTTSTQVLGVVAHAINIYGQEIATNKGSVTIQPVVQSTSTNPFISNTSVTYGTLSFGQSTTTQIQTFAFSETVKAGDYPMYISKDGPIAFPMKIDAPMNFTIDAPSFVSDNSAGDTSSYLYIAPGQTKTFTSNLIAKGQYGSVVTVIVDGLNYGTSTASLYSAHLNAPILQNNLKAVLFH